jgi:phage-related protein
MDWNPISWLRGLGDLSSAVLGEIEKYVKKAINYAIQHLVKLLNALFHTLASTVQGIVHQLSAVIHIANDVANQLAHIQSTILGVIYGWADGFVHHQIIPLIENILSSVWDAVGIVQNGLAAVTKLLEGVTIGAFHQVLAFIHNFTHMINAWWHTAEQAFIHDVVDPVINTVMDAYHRVTGIIDWVENTAMGAIDLVLKAAPFLEMVVKYSVAEIEAVISDATHNKATDLVSSEMGTLSQFEKDLAATLDRIFQ